MLTSIHSKGVGDIIITEFSPNEEWVEVLNRSNHSVDITKYYVVDNKKNVNFADTTLIIFPNQLFLFADSPSDIGLGLESVYSIPSGIILNNDGDSIEIYSADSTLSDCIVYNKDCVGSDSQKSLIRKDYSIIANHFDMWICGLKSPGYINPKVIDKDKILVSMGPSPFTPNGDGVDDYFQIKLSNAPTAIVTLEIYGFQGRMLFNTVVPESGVYRWNGVCNSGRAYPTGPFFVVVIFENGLVVKREAILWR